MTLPQFRPLRARRTNDRLRMDRGQALVEFALILPILVLLLVLALDFGRVFFGWVAVTNATRIGANEAARNPDLWKNGGTDTLYYDRMAADLLAINCDADTNNDGRIDAADLPAPAFVNRTGTADPHEFGDHVKVTLTCDFGLMTPIASQLLGDHVTVSADTTFSVVGAEINGIPVPADPPTSPCLPSERIVPSLVGMSVSSARAKWSAAGFTGALSPTDAAADSDTVTSQTTTPSAGPGSCLAYYATVTVGHTAPTVCTAPQVNVPNMIGTTVAVARSTWASAGFTGTFTPSAGDDAKEVLTQSVAPSATPGACADPTSSVVVTFGDPPPPPTPMCTAPQLVGLKASTASSTWTTAGFTGSFAMNPANKSNWYVKAQNLVGGQDYACTSSVVVYLENR